MIPSLRLPIRLLLTALLAAGTTAAESFAYAMPLDGGPQGLVDLSALNHRPAGSLGPVTVRSGHFALAGSGERIRFLGVALTFAAAFPDPEVGRALAQRLARLGINCVRIHYIDGGTAGRFGRHSIWDPAFPHEARLDPAQLDRLDRLLAALREQGIYYDLNLKVGRVFGSADGLPEGYLGEATQRITKSFDLIDPRLISLQRSYAEALLGHVNPYTGLAYANDPAVMAVELNNENSLLLPHHPIDEAVSWPAAPAEAMRAAWNRWLAAHYRDGAALRAAWAEGCTAEGAPLPLDQAGWRLEQNVSGKGELQAGANGFAATISATNGTAWHVQATLPLPALAAGTAMTLVVSARADRDRPVIIRHELAQAPWTLCGVDSAVPLAPQWRTIHLPCTIREAAGPSRLVVRLGGAPGRVELADLRLVAGRLPPELPADADPATGGVPLPVAPQGRQRADWLRCCLDAESDFARGMREHLRGLGVRAPVICGQASWGPQTGVLREQASDYLDDHQYWDHPQAAFRDPATLRGHGRPLVGALGGASPVAELARWRVAGMPFSVSEFNHCAPNPHRAEALPIIASVAALQDWDALVLHEYGAPPTPLAMVWQPFETGSDPALMCFLPSAALAFRAGAIAALPAAEFRPLTGEPAAMWSAADCGARLLRARLGLDLGRPAGNPALAAGWAAPGSASASLSPGERPVYACAGPGLVAMAGFLGGTTTAAGGCRFAATASEADFGAITVAALDGRPLADSRRILVTAMAGSGNTGMQRKADGSGLDSWGTAPVRVTGLGGTLDLAVGPGLRARAIDAAGVPLRRLDLLPADGRARLQLDASLPAVWYVLDEGD